MEKTNFLRWALIVSLGLNVYWALSSTRDVSRQVLASADGSVFRRSDLSQDAQRNLTLLDGAGRAVLKKEAENWVENVLLPKEAQSRGKTVQELLQEETVEKTQVSPEEVRERLVHSPAADTLPYPRVLQEIENDLRGTRQQALKKTFLQSLYPKYRARIPYLR